MPPSFLFFVDEPKLCETLKSGLELTGDFEVFVAHSGKEGIRKAKRLKPDAILLDICMPGMDGLAVLRTLKSQYPLEMIPVIMLSSLLDSSVKQECNQEYGEEYIEKPVGILELKNRIEAALQRMGRLPPPGKAAPPRPPPF